MKGHITKGEPDPARGAQGGRRAPFMFHLTMKIDDVDHFVTSPEHEARAEGWIEHEPFGGRRPVERATFNLFTHDGDPARKRMLYRLFFSDAGGRPYTLSGFKDVHDDPGPDVWRDTTTLFTRIYEGHVSAADEAQAAVHGAGVLIIFELDFIRQLGTFRVDAPTQRERLEALSRFGGLFLGKLWDVYAKNFLTYAPF
jgi:cholesterol oxidase